ncbi:MAG: hypothetical protein JNM56_22900 [Planctomycetia bacterium]|nr:hypothetical protein [Planctomycetia bacterium]
MEKKDKHCNRSDPADNEQGDYRDYVALDPEHRLFVSLVTGRHSGEHVQLLVEDFHRRAEGRRIKLMTSDENSTYAQAIVKT